ncbi:MAG: hypothetical protein NC338_07320 [Firmicutes bacterium]|nr:hypothetical protein [Bacillota bacterium]MCM1401805.1 hypothetical protein [Bacteroides sp.]MCM1477686.1 hypothetical protein [Bacteroides sp.]
MTSANINQFSPARLKMTFQYFFPAIKLPLLLYVATSLSVGIIYMLLQQSATGVVMSGLLQFILSIMLYFFPLLLYRTYNPVVQTMLPSTAGEKLTVFFIMCLVINPIVVYLPFNGMQWAMAPFINADPLFSDIKQLSISMSEIMQGTGWLQSLPPVATCMFVVVTSARKRVGLAVGMTILTIVGLSLLSGIAGAVMAFNTNFEAFVNVSGTVNPSELGELMAEWLKPLIVVIISACTAYTLFMTWLSYRKLKHMQV